MLFYELFTYILPNKHILRNGNPSVTLFACQLPLHKGAFGAVETYTHLLYLWQAEHLAVHRMQVTGQLPGPATQEKLANHFDLPVFLFHFSVKNTKQMVGDYFLFTQLSAQKIQQNQCAQYDTVNAKYAEAVLANILHQSLDNHQAHHKGNQAADDQYADLRAGSCSALHQEL